MSWKSAWAASSPCCRTPWRIGRQGRVEVGGEVEVVEPGQGDVVGDPETAGADRLKRADRGRVVGAEDRVGAAVEQHGGTGFSGLAVEVAVDDQPVGRQPGAVHGPPVAGQAVLAGDRPTEARDVPDPAPADLHEVRGDCVRGQDVVDVNVAGGAVVPAGAR